MAGIAAPLHAIGVFLPVKYLPQPTLRGSSLWLRGLQAALQAAPFACMELSTICRLRWRLARSHISATRLFVHFHSTNPTIPQIHKSRHPTNPQTPLSYPKQKEHSLLVLPSVDTIINFANKFFDMLTKKQSEHPQKVFQVFQVFRVFQVVTIQLCNNIIKI